MEVNGELHASAALLPAKSLPVAVAQKAGWAPQQVWTVLRRQRSLGPAGWVLSRSSSRQSFHYTQYATPAALDCHYVTLIRFLSSTYFHTIISHQNILTMSSGCWRNYYLDRAHFPNAFVTILCSTLNLISILLLIQLCGEKIKMHTHIFH